MISSRSLLAGAAAALILALTTSCATKVSVPTMKEIQDNNGVYTKSLYYAGSNSKWHYFDQEVHLLDPRIFDNKRMVRHMIPGDQNEGWESYRVPREEVEVPADIEFPRSSYRGEDDERHLKVRIKADNNGEKTYRVERRLASHVRNKNRKPKKPAELKRPEWAEPREGRSVYRMEL